MSQGTFSTLSKLFYPWVEMEKYFCNFTRLNVVNSGGSTSSGGIALKCVPYDNLKVIKLFMLVRNVF